ncbi:Sodium- and chloride-dependent GABA transporter [Ooceraea biroi]|uniref:Sodium-and chloride-dependent GABA transporter n=1 Tax=Ooceraea biroi TaxID=2015173 RepID=A0A026X2I8_OOCBI|nr:Sodium- and chloride-dependent GABA transporter [Ooceraea biroi]
MAEKMYYWGEERDQVDPDQTFIEFKAKADKRREQTRAVPKMTVSSPQGKMTELSNRVEDAERGGWDNKLDFLFSCISVSVGLGNVWRFPYLCYKNGGERLVQSFVTFIMINATKFSHWTKLSLLSCYPFPQASPTFEVKLMTGISSGLSISSSLLETGASFCILLYICLELKFQFSFITPLKSLRLVFSYFLIVSPPCETAILCVQIAINFYIMHFNCVGYATMTIVFFLDVYYCIIIAWTLFYLISTFVTLPQVPWKGCENVWNTYDCFDAQGNKSVHGRINCSNSAENNTCHHTTPVEEYWEQRVLGITSGIETIGNIQLELLACLIIGWLLVYFIIRRGLHQSGKIIWFSALFPYVVLFILLGRAVTLEGSYDGLLYYVTPRWNELLSPGPWIDGATQIFFAYSIGTGALPALGSYNKFHHNCYRDAIITCVVNTLTCLLAGCVTFSILGHIAQEQQTQVSEVVKSGPGLVFLTYPEVVLKLPGASLWAIIFFIMLLILGIDSEFCIVESFITGMVDYWPDVLRPHRNKFTIAICLIMFALGIPMVTNGGIYIFQLMDFYSASGMSILWVCFFQTIAISWIFGAKKFCDCVHQMMGIRLNGFWYICWVVLAPVIMLFIFVFQIVQYKSLKYGSNYEYPTWAEIVGVCLSLSSMIWIPAYALYYVIVTPGSIKENILKGLQPNIKSHAKLPKGEKSAVIPMSESSAGLITKNNSFLSQT